MMEAINRFKNSGIVPDPGIIRKIPELEARYKSVIQLEEEELKMIKIDPNHPECFVTVHETEIPENQVDHQIVLDKSLSQLTQQESTQFFEFSGADMGNFEKHQEEKEVDEEEEKKQAELKAEIEKARNERQKAFALRIQEKKDLKKAELERNVEKARRDLQNIPPPSGKSKRDEYAEQRALQNSSLQKAMEDLGTFLRQEEEEEEEDEEEQKLAELQLKTELQFVGPQKLKIEKLYRNGFKTRICKWQIQENGPEIIGTFFIEEGRVKDINFSSKSEVLVIHYEPFINNLEENESEYYDKFHFMLQNLTNDGKKDNFSIYQQEEENLITFQYSDIDSFLLIQTNREWKYLYIGQNQTNNSSSQLREEVDQRKFAYIINNQEDGGLFQIEKKIQRGQLSYEEQIEMKMSRYKEAEEEAPDDEEDDFDDQAYFLSFTLKKLSPANEQNPEIVDIQEIDCSSLKLLFPLSSDSFSQFFYHPQSNTAVYTLGKQKVIIIDLNQMTKHEVPLQKSEYALTQQLNQGKIYTQNYLQKSQEIVFSEYKIENNALVKEQVLRVKAQNQPDIFDFISTNGNLMFIHFDEKSKEIFLRIRKEESELKKHAIKLKEKLEFNFIEDFICSKESQDRISLRNTLVPWNKAELTLKSMRILCPIKTYDIFAKTQDKAQAYLVQCPLGYMVAQVVLDDNERKSFQARESFNFNSSYSKLVPTEAIKENEIPFKPVIQASLRTFQITIRGRKNAITGIVLQYLDKILLKCINYDYKKIIDQKLAPIKAVFIENQIQENICLYVTYDEGSKIKLISFKKGSDKITQTVVREPSSKIILLLRNQARNFIATVDDNHIVKVYSMQNIGQNDKESLSLNFISEIYFSKKDKKKFERLLKQRKIDFAQAHISNDMVISIFGEDFQLNKTLQQAQIIERNEILTEKQEESSKDSLLQGPYVDSSFYHIYNLKEKEVKYSSKRDLILESKGNKIQKFQLLTLLKPEFITFLPSQRVKDEQILIKEGYDFYFLKPNGELIKKTSPLMQIGYFKKAEHEIKNNAGFICGIHSFSPDMKSCVLSLDLEKDKLHLKFLYNLYEENQEEVIKPMANSDSDKALFSSIKSKFFMLDELVGKDGNSVLPPHLQAHLQQQPRTSFKDFEAILEPKHETKNLNRVRLDFVGQEDSLENLRSIDWDSSITNESQFNYLEFYWTEKKAEIYLYQHDAVHKVPTQGKIGQEFMEKALEKAKEEKKSFLKTVFTSEYCIFYSEDEPKKFYYFFIERRQVGEPKIGELKLLPVQIPEESVKVEIWAAGYLNSIQILYEKIQEGDSFTCLTSWNLDKNKEVNSLIKKVKSQDFQFIKGVNSGYGFALIDTQIFDAETGFPLKYFDEIEIEPQEEKKGLQPLLINENRDMCIEVQSNMVRLQLGSSFQQRELFKILDNPSQFQLKNLEQNGAPLELLEAIDPYQRNIFHFLMKNLKLLKAFIHQFEKHLDQLETEEEVKDQIDSYLQILQVDNRDLTPFQVAMKTSNSFIEIFLICLAKLEGRYLVSRYVFKDINSFQYLLSLNLESFEDFLAFGVHRNEQMEPIRVYQWKRNSDHVQVPAQTPMISAQVIDDSIGEQPKAALFNQRGVEDTIAKRVRVSMLDNEIVFQEGFSQIFIHSLAKSDSESIFDVQQVKVCIQLIWKLYFKQIFKRVFLPQVLYFVVFIFYSSVLYSDKTYSRDAGERVPVAHYIIGASLLVWALYILYLEVLQLKTQKWAYFTSYATFWNFVDLISTSLVITFVTFDWLEVNYDKGKNLASYAILSLWVKMFYFLRIFHPTAAFIRMITEVIKDISIFTVMLGVSLLAFANAFFILDGAWNESVVKVRAMGDSFWNVIANTYMTGLGEFASDDYGTSEHSVALWVFFVFCTLFVQIIFLNLLIALISDTFDKVQEIKTQAQLKECCRLISENFYLVDLEKEFQGSKYILVFEVEKAEEGLRDQKWEGRLTNLKNYLKRLVKSTKFQLRFIHSQQKDELGQVQRKLVQQLTQVQHQMLKGQKSQRELDSQVKKRVQRLAKKLG